MAAEDPGKPEPSELGPADPLLAFTEQSPVFRALGEAGRARLAAAAKEIQLPAGTVVIREGEDGDAFYALLEGTLEVTAKGLDDEPRFFATLERGAVFGEIGVLTREPRTATVTARTPVRLLVWEMLSALGVLKDHPEALAELGRLGLARSEAILAGIIE